MSLPRVYVCDDNPRMRQLIAERLDGHAVVAGSGGTAEEAIEATGRLAPDVVVLDYRTAAAQLGETIAAIKERHPQTVVAVHTGVPRSLIGEQVAAAGGVYSPKNEPEHLVGLVRRVRPGVEEAAFPDS